MPRLKVVHLFNFQRGSRYSTMISQGLWSHPDIDVSFSMPFISLGQVICPADESLRESLILSDYIFRPNDQHFGLDEYDAFLDEKNLWKRVIYYDLKDSPSIDTHRLQNCAAYIKRSWPVGYNRLQPPLAEKPLLPMDYSLLNEYFEEPFSAVKDIDIACLFPDDPIIGKRRYSLVQELQKVTGKIPKMVVGTVTAADRVGRRAIFDSSTGNPFLEYLNLLKRSKVVFTAYPDEWDGDSRTWEAFSSKAMVFMDATYIPSPYPFEHLKHCFIYDARDRQSIRNAIHHAQSYLNNDEERKSIAEEGHTYALQHHMPINRIDQILKWISSDE